MKTISKIQSGIHFQAPDSRWVMKITPDRKIVINEDVEVSEAAITLIGLVNDMTKPKEWQGLSDDEIWNIANFLGKNKEWDYPVMFAKTIEQALKEKNNEQT